MNLKQMRYFVAVAENLHFGRAAARLHVVQPAVSQQIRLLETDLGVDLFERSSRRVALTDAGKAYLVEAGRALRQVDLAAQAARDAAGGLTGVITIGFVDNALWMSLPRLVREFRRQFPRIELSLLQMPRGDQLSALHNHQIDVAILPGPISDEALDLHELARRPIYVVVPRGHPLAAGDEIAMRDLAGETFVTIPSVDNPRRINEIVHALCAKAGFAPRFGQPVQQLQTALSLVSAGLGVAIVPEWMRHAWSEDVEYRPVSPRSDYSLMVATMHGHDRPAIAGFLNIMRAFTG